MNEPEGVEENSDDSTDTGETVTFVGNERYLGSPINVEFTENCFSQCLHAERNLINITDKAIRDYMNDYVMAVYKHNWITGGNVKYTIKGEEDLMKLEDNGSNHPFKRRDLVRIRRLILEALEVGILTCFRMNIYFGPAQMVNLFRQILPTAYVLNTSYWPLYEIENERKCICFCEFFKIDCPHDIGVAPFLNLVTDYYFFNKTNPEYTYENFKLTISVIDEETAEVTLYLILKDSNEKLKIVFKIKLIEAVCNYSTKLIILKPHPLLLNEYGTYIPNLLEYTAFRDKLMPSIYCLNIDACPKYTIVVQDQIKVRFDTIVSPEGELFG